MELPLASLLPLADKLLVCQVDNIKFTHQVCAITECYMVGMCSV